MSYLKTVLSMLLLSAFISAPLHAEDKETSRLKRKAVQYYKQSQSHSARGANGSAYELASKAFTVGEQVFEPTSESYGLLALNFANAAVLGYKEKTADHFLQKHMHSIVDIFGEHSNEHLEALLLSGHALLKNRNIGGSRKIYNQLLGIIEEKNGKASYRYGITEFRIAQRILIVTGKSYGTTMLKRAQKTMMALDTDEAEEQLRTLLFWEGKLHLAKKKYSSAQRVFEEVLATLEEQDPKSPLILNALAFLVEVHEKRRHSDTATKYALEIGRRSALYNLKYNLPLYKEPAKHPNGRGRSKGKVKVSFTVDENGYVIDPKVVSSDMSSAFEKATIKSILQFRYAPRFQNGKPVKSGGHNFTVNWNRDD